jgi:hypothetical protein
MTGRLFACAIAPSKVRVSVIGPIVEDIREVLGAEAENDVEFKFIPGGLILTFPAERAAEALTLLRHGLSSFINAAMTRVRRSVSLEDHVPEAVAYIASVLCRELPQPIPEAQDSEQLDDASDEDDTSLSREPRVRGRAPIFDHGQHSIASLMNAIEQEVIACSGPSSGKIQRYATSSTRSLWGSRWGHSFSGTHPTRKTRVPSEPKGRACGLRPWSSMVSNALHRFTR